MPGLEDLYREIILDHYRTPRNRGELETPPATKVDGHNPLCGDEITVYLQVEGSGDDAVVTDVKIGGQGCSISQSSASMMTGVVMGKSVGEIRAVTRRFKIDDGSRRHRSRSPATTTSTSATSRRCRAS